MLRRFKKIFGIGPKFPAKIDKASIAALPLTAYKGPIIIVKDIAGVNKALKVLNKETVLGFDTETRPSFKKGQSYPVSLLQLCGENKAYLFQLNHLGGLPDKLAQLMANPNIIKTGVAVHDDIKGLQALNHFEPGAFVELAKITKTLGIEQTGLRALVAILLGTRISKNAQVSNWGRKELTKQQITYAATDAWIGRELWLKLDSLKK